MLSPRRAAACLLGLLLLFGAAWRAAADNAFPFGSELMLDAAPKSGSKRVPMIEIDDNGAASIDLWCVSLKAIATVGAGTIAIVPQPGVQANPVAPPSCPPDRQASDAALLAMLAQMTGWRRAGDLVELSGPTTLRFHLMTN